jgi:hypothetical protein
VSYPHEPEMGVVKEARSKAAVRRPIDELYGRKRNTLLREKEGFGRGMWERA